MDPIDREPIGWEIPELWDARLVCQAVALDLPHQAERNAQLWHHAAAANRSQQQRKVSTAQQTTDPYLPPPKRRKRTTNQQQHQHEEQAQEEDNAGYESDVSVSSGGEASDDDQDASNTWTCYNYYSPEWRHPQQLLLCGAANQPCAYRCSACGAQRSDVQLRMRVAAALQTSDLYRASHKQLCRRVLGQCGSAGGPGLRFPPQLVTAEVDRQVAERLEGLAQQVEPQQQPAAHAEQQAQQEAAGGGRRAERRHPPGAQQQQGQQEDVVLDPAVGAGLPPTAQLLLPALLSNLRHQQAELQMRPRSAANILPAAAWQAAAAAAAAAQQAPPAAAAAAGPSSPPGPPPAAVVLSRAAHRKVKRAQQQGHNPGAQLPVLDASYSSGSDEEYVPEGLLLLPGGGGARSGGPARYELRGRGGQQAAAAAAAEPHADESAVEQQQQQQVDLGAAAMEVAPSQAGGSSRQRGLRRHSHRTDSETADAVPQQQQQQQPVEVAPERLEAIGRDLAGLALLLQQAVAAQQQQQGPCQQASHILLGSHKPLALLTYGLSAAAHQQHNQQRPLARGWIPGDCALPAVYYNDEGAIARQPAAATAAAPQGPSPTSTSLSPTTILSLLGASLPLVEELYCFKGRAVAKGLLPPAAWLLPSKPGKLPAVAAPASQRQQALLPQLSGGRLQVVRCYDAAQLLRARQLQAQGMYEAQALAQLLREWQRAAPCQLWCGLLLEAAAAAEEQQEAGPSTSAAGGGSKEERWGQLWVSYQQQRQEQQQRLQQHFEGIPVRQGSPWQRHQPAAAGSLSRPAGAAGGRCVAVALAAGGSGSGQWGAAVDSAAAALGLRSEVVEAARRRFLLLLGAGQQ